MEQVYYVLANLAYYLLSAIELLLFLRAILSWFLNEEDNRFMYVIVLMTEPILIPFRLLLNRIEKNKAIPIDFSLVFAMITVMILQMILTIVA